MALRQWTARVRAQRRGASVHTAVARRDGAGGAAPGAGGRPPGATQHRLRREDHGKHSRRRPRDRVWPAGRRLPSRAEADRETKLEPGTVRVPALIQQARARGLTAGSAGEKENVMTPGTAREARGGIRGRRSWSRFSALH